MIGTVSTYRMLAVAIALSGILTVNSSTEDRSAALNQHTDYVCAEAPDLATADTNSDGILTVGELQRLAALGPDSRDLEPSIDDMVDRGYSGIQYDGNCEGTQPDTGIDARLIALEARVADLEARIVRLEAFLDLESAPTQEPQGTQGQSRRESVEAAPGIITVSGTGSTVTDDFRLEAGRYEVAISIQSGCCVSVFLHGPNTDGDLLFNEIFGFDSEGGEASIIYEIPAPGDYFIDSQNVQGPWTITFRKR